MKTADEVRKLIRKARDSLGLSGAGERQQALLRRAREAFGLTNDALAAALEVPAPTLMAWLAPDDAAKHRTMPVDSRLALQRVLGRRGKAK